MSPSMEKERVDHQVLNPVLSGTEPDRNTLAAYQIRLAAFFGISVYQRLERCVGTHPEKLWVKIPNYFCLSGYYKAERRASAAPGSRSDGGAQQLSWLSRGPRRFFRFGPPGCARPSEASAWPCAS